VNGEVDGLAVWALTAAALFVLLDLAYTAVLVAASALSRVGLYRLSGDLSPQLAFVERLSEPQSPHRLATLLIRQLCLLGSVFLSAVAARRLGWGFPAVAGVATGALVGVLAAEALAAHSVALWDPRRTLRRLAPLVVLARGLLYPIVQPLGLLLGRLGRGAQLPPDDEREEEQEEAEALIDVGERSGILEADESEMMRGIVDLDETRVREIMTPRTEIVALPLETTVAEARRVILDQGHSRIPVFRETMDNIVGVLHARELLRAWEELEEADREPIQRYLREAMFVPEPLSASELLSKMRVRTHLALVVDEYGGIAGLITLEDLLEEIVGDIQDEHDHEEAMVVDEGDGCWRINASAHVDELTELFRIEYDDRDFDTVGGLIVSHLGRVPALGEVLQIGGLRFEVLESDRRRIRQVRVRSTDGASEAEVGP
jgi:CBS domain containing-hemolysin-like protein